MKRNFENEICARRQMGESETKKPFYKIEKTKKMASKWKNYDRNM